MISKHHTRTVRRASCSLLLMSEPHFTISRFIKLNIEQGKGGEEQDCFPSQHFCFGLWVLDAAFY